MPYVVLALLNLNLVLFSYCPSIHFFKMLVKAHLGSLLSEPEDKEGLWVEIVDEEPFYYNGKAIKPAVKVYEGEQELWVKDYKISYSNNKNAGAEAKITVTGKGNYTGILLNPLSSPKQRHRQDSQSRG